MIAKSVWADVFSFNFRHSPRVASHLWDETEIADVSVSEGCLFAIASPAIFPPLFSDPGNGGFCGGKF